LFCGEMPLHSLAWIKQIHYMRSDNVENQLKKFLNGHARAASLESYPLFETSLGRSVPPGSPSRLLLGQSENQQPAHFLP
jgi:hypothetical protein